MLAQLLMFLLPIGLTYSNPLCPPVKPPRSNPRCDWVPKYDFRFCIREYTCEEPTTPAPIVCPYLNPSEHGDLHWDSDWECLTGRPGWGQYDTARTCRCDYLVKDKDANGCAINFSIVCKQLKRWIADGWQISKIEPLFRSKK